MAYLTPSAVARAAAALFGPSTEERRASTYCLSFFYLKAAGATVDTAVTVTADNEPPAPLKALAAQPDGFAEFVAETPAARWGRGIPSRKGGTNNTLYWPICKARDEIIRSNETMRSAVQTNLKPTAPRSGNPDRASYDDVYDTQGGGTESLVVKFRPGYVAAAAWFYGPREGASMRIPLKPLAVWMHRLEADAPVSIEQLIDRTKTKLNLTAEELEFLFDVGYAFPLEEADFENERDNEAYFNALCLDPPPIPGTNLSFYDTERELEPRRYNLTRSLLGLGSNRATPLQLAQKLIAAGERNLLLFGPPRTGKSYAAIEIAATYLEVSQTAAMSDPRVTRIQFHPGWTYGDFMRKLAPVPTADSLRFERATGTFLRHCTDFPSARSVVIIDEINRASIATVFGEAFQVIEVGRRGQAIVMPGSISGDEITSLTIPKELLVIATGNNLDRSTLELDFAFLERFSTIDVDVDRGKALQILRDTNGWSEDTARNFIRDVIFPIEQQVKFPIGHTHYYDLKNPASVPMWYRSKLRPSIRTFLTQFRESELAGIDQIIDTWTIQQTER
jgi:MoxR-like ATPase